MNRSGITALLNTSYMCVSSVYCSFNTAERTLRSTDVRRSSCTCYLFTSVNTQSYNHYHIVSFSEQISDLKLLSSCYYSHHLHPLSSLHKDIHGTPITTPRTFEYLWQVIPVGVNILDQWRCCQCMSLPRTTKWIRLNESTKSDSIFVENRNCNIRLR